MKKKSLKKKIKNQDKLQTSRKKKNKRISAFVFDPSSDEALENLRENSFPRTTIRKIKNFPFKLIKLIQKKKRLLQTYGIKTWFSGRRKIFSFKIYWFKKNRRFLIKSHALKKKILENLSIRIYYKIQIEKKEFQKKYDFFNNEIMESEADYLRLINLQKYYENRILTS